MPKNIGYGNEEGLYDLAMKKPNKGSLLDEAGYKS